MYSKKNIIEHFCVSPDSFVQIENRSGRVLMYEDQNFVTELTPQNIKAHCSDYLIKKINKKGWLLGLATPDLDMSKTILFLLHPIALGNGSLAQSMLSSQRRKI